jgi:putative glycosyltransferase (TIGR04348 family)
VSPYAASANNGNWRTAARWAELLAPTHEVIVRTPGDPLHDAGVLIALHARRSHATVCEWRERFGRRPCVVVLTGTDLYRDVPQGDADALESLRLADRLIVLQERGIAALPAPFRAKAAVVYQSAPRLAPYAKSARTLRALFCGHLREEKDPLTFVRAACSLAARRDIAFALVGGARDAALADQVKALAARAQNLALLGAMPHAQARERIRRAHVLVVPSRMEGGANVVVEALTAGTAVLASDCDGNVGMLGERYPGYFPVGDAAALAALVLRCREDAVFLGRLTRLCAARAARFLPAAERRALLAALDTPPGRGVSRRNALTER